jgi:hypothetical protein
MNNSLIGGIVAVVAFLIVGGAALLGLQALLGEWSVLMWVGLGLAALFGIARKVNA